MDDGNASGLDDIHGRKKEKLYRFPRLVELRGLHSNNSFLFYS
jgi:hypothetical protein